jgi:hypothetical protein
MMVTEVPIGSTWVREVLKEIGVDLAAIMPGDGNFGHRCLVVDTLPAQADMLDNVLYFVRAP